VATLNTEQTNNPIPYVGRFAPSPSGSLHFGSLLSALASFLDAKSNNGKWLLRIDNIDPPREQLGSIKKILDTLEAFELHWDGPIIYQSQNLPNYLSTCISLIKDDLVYPCTCSRKQLAGHKQYPGYCRRKLSAQEKSSLINTVEKEMQKVFNSEDQLTLSPQLNSFSLRVNTQDFNMNALAFNDTLMGEQTAPKDFGDFIVLRKDALPSYMLACGLDDIQKNITHIVRGSDLLEATLWQRFLQIQTTHKQPKLSYSHLPLILNEQHQKLSKQHHATEIDPKENCSLLYQALCALGQNPDSKLIKESAATVINWAIAHWQLANVPAQNILLSSLGYKNPDKITKTY
jgi:glutamyl-Q tRNA(Asp) synthetase